jgi:hypothetical protein
MRDVFMKRWTGVILTLLALCHGVVALAEVQRPNSLMTPELKQLMEVLRPVDLGQSDRSTRRTVNYVSERKNEMNRSVQRLEESAVKAGSQPRRMHPKAY